MNTENNITNQTYALAAIFQAAHCVNSLAQKGSTSTDDLKTLINSIFIDDAPTTIAIYNSTDNLFQGFQTLCSQLNSSTNNPDINIARIVISLLVLERKLANNSAMLQQLDKGIARARQQAQHFDSVTHENVLANLASLYESTISTLFPKVMVMGEQHHLSNIDIVNKVRSLLLAGIRAAVLFRQLGGRRWHLIFRRKKFIAAAEHALKNRNFSHTV